MAETQVQRNVRGIQRDLSHELIRAERRGRALAIEHPLLALSLALFGGYCLGRALART